MFCRNTRVITSGKNRQEGGKGHSLEAGTDLREAEPSPLVLSRGHRAARLSKTPPTTCKTSII